LLILCCPRQAATQVDSKATQSEDQQSIDNKVPNISTLLKPANPQLLRQAADVYSGPDGRKVSVIPAHQSINIFSISEDWVGIKESPIYYFVKH
jgi:hypothetical protein